MSAIRLIPKSIHSGAGPSFTALALCVAALLPGKLAAESPMHTAICAHDLAKVKELVAAGNSVNQQYDGSYPLELAAYCYGGSPAIADFLLSKGANVNLHKANSYNALMWAIRSYRSTSSSDPMRRVIFRMLGMGANARFIDNTTGRTPLMGAAENGDTELVTLLRDKGADPAPRTKGDWCVSGNYDLHCSAADYARLGGHVELALDMEGKDSSTYRSTLHYAVIKGDLARVEKLIAQGANLNEAETLSKLTPLHYAQTHDRTEIAMALLKAGANPNSGDFAGVTPLRNAIVQYKQDFARMLIDHGAKANNGQTQGCGGGLSEFGWSIEYGQHDLSRYMIERNAVDPRNPGRAFQEAYGRSAEDVPIVELLIQKGARPTQPDIDALRQIEGANDWIRQSGHIGKIIAMLETAMKEKPPANVPVPPRPMPPVPPEFEARFRGGLPAGVKIRSLKKPAPAIQSFDQRSRNAKGALAPTSSREPK